MKPTIPTMLSFNGGYVDAAGYLALQGLFTAHVTGNFVTIGGALVFGTSGVTAKLLALPVFCIVIIGSRLASFNLPRRWPVLETMLTLELLLLIFGAVLAIRLGPFANGDRWPAITTGMTLVAAMAIQNAVHRIHLDTAPPPTLMTGTTTQIMIDIADLMRGLPANARDATRARLRRLCIAVEHAHRTAIGGSRVAIYVSTVTAVTFNPRSRLLLSWLGRFSSWCAPAAH